MVAGFDLWVCLLGCVWVRVVFGFRCFGVSSTGVAMRGWGGLIVALVFLGIAEGWCVAVVCFSEVWCLGLLDDSLVCFVRCFCVNWCLDSRMWLVVLL